MGVVGVVDLAGNQVANHVVDLIEKMGGRCT